MKKVVVLNSGGFDSTLLIKFLKHDYKVELHSVYFSYGQFNDIPAAECAKMNAEKYCDSHRVITLPEFNWTSRDFYGSDWKSQSENYLEARNLIFASYAASFAQSIGADTVAMALIDGLNTENPYPDSTCRFAKKLNRLFREFGLSFKAPFIISNKTSLLQMGAAFGVPIESFLSCDKTNTHTPCGVCPDCEALEEYKEYVKILSNPIDN